MSVIIPTYADRTARLQSALASIWAQEGLGEQFDVEPIVVGENSSGHTEEVVRRFPGTRFLRLEANRGAAAARNAGLSQAVGKYVAFLDDDDLWLPRRLSLQVPVLERAQGAEIAYSQFVRVRHDGTSNVAPAPDGPSGWILESIFKADIVQVPTVLIPREAFDKVGSFNERLHRAEDKDMWMRLALRFPFTYVPGAVAVYLDSNVPGAYADECIADWLIVRDEILAIAHETRNEAKLRSFIPSGTFVHVVSTLLFAGRLDEARRTLLQSLQEFPALESDSWYGSQMRTLTLELALAFDSRKGTRHLFAEVKRTAGRGGLRHRLRMRALLADLWTSVALRHASGRRRNDRMAGTAASRAILQNPLKPLSRPGLLRLVARAFLVLVRRPRTQPVSGTPRVQGSKTTELIEVTPEEEAEVRR